MFALVLSLALGADHVLAQSYPSRPVRVVVPMVPGGGVDLVSRLISQKLAEAFKQPVLVENRGGAGGNVGANAVAKAEPDGYTYLMSTAGLAISPNIYRKLPFDPTKDLVPVVQIYNTLLILVVNPSVPANSVGDLIALAKSQPGRLNYASTGPGGTPHLAAEQFKALTGTDITHIPYKGTSQMDAAVLANEVQMIFTTQPGALPHLKSGKLRALAIAGKSRSAALPDVPTLVEAGVRDYELPNWLGLFAPAGTSREIVARLNAEVLKILAMPEIRERIVSFGAEPVGSSPEEFAATYKADLAKFARVVKQARIPLQE